jgi:hypothetical protein
MVSKADFKKIISIFFERHADQKGKTDQEEI